MKMLALEKRVFRAKKGQTLDPDLKVIRSWLEMVWKPIWQEISRPGPTVKGYWLQLNSLQSDDLIIRK